MILVVGHPRSGTTWAGKIFDSHPDTLYRHEPDSVIRTGLPVVVRRAEFVRYRQDARDYVRTLATVRTPKASAKLPLFRKRYHSALTHNVRRCLVLSAKVAERIWRPYRIPDFVGDADRKGIRMVWKSIESTGRLGLLVRALPELRALHIVRHPCGVIASVLRHDRIRDKASSEDYGMLAKLIATEAGRSRELTIERLRSLAPVERLAWRWALANEKAMTETASASNCLTFRYEDLCADPLLFARRLFDFARLSWQPQTERFIRDSTRHNSGHIHSVYKVPADAATRWRDELALEDVERILAITRDTLPGQLYGE